MLLAVDIGNTNIVLGLFDEENRQLSSLRMETIRTRSSTEYLSALEHFLAAHPPITSIIISSVVPQANGPFKKFCADSLKIKPFFVSDEIENLGIKILIDNPQEVGADRIVNAIAFFHKYKRAGIIIDFGTATTFDVVSQNGDYLGGMISPGINLSLAALTIAAAKLPQITIAKPQQVIGKSTVTAMQSGLYYGYLGLIEKSVEEITGEMQKSNIEEPLVIATGGLAGFFAESKAIEKIEENLTLDGLIIINNERKKGERLQVRG